MLDAPPKLEPETIEEPVPKGVEKSEVPDTGVTETAVVNGGVCADPKRDAEVVPNGVDWDEKPVPNTVDVDVDAVGVKKGEVEGAATEVGVLNIEETVADWELPTDCCGALDAGMAELGKLIAP